MPTTLLGAVVEPEGYVGAIAPRVLWLTFKAVDDRTVTAPVLLADGQLLRYPSSWLIRAAEANCSAATLDKRARALQRWFEYVSVFPPTPLAPDAAKKTIQLALRSYFTGFINRLAEGYEKLKWTQIQINSARIYGGHVAEFADWLTEQSGFNEMIGPDPWVPAGKRHWSEVQKRIERDILGHLLRTTQVGRGLEVVRATKLKTPRWDLGKQISRSRHDGSFDHPEARKGYRPAAMPLDDYFKLLEATRAAGNWRDLCLWLLLGAGCCRVSEALNLYATDVYFTSDCSSEARNRIGSDETLVALANPVEGLVQTADGSWVKRRDFLCNQYGLVPRNLLAINHPLFAGYKGMALGGSTDESIPELDLWPKRGWALIEWLFPLFGRMFAIAILKYRRELIKSGISSIARSRHPYLLMNVGRNCANPLTRLNVNQLLSVACRRAGIRERGPHSMRHMYGAECARLGITVGETQIRMRHGSPESTLVYYNMPREEARKRFRAADSTLVQRHQHMLGLEKDLPFRLF